MLLLSVLGYGSSCSHIPPYKAETSAPPQGPDLRNLSACPKPLSDFITCLILDKLWFPLLMCSVLAFVIYLNMGTFFFARLYFTEELRRNSIQSGTFLSYPAELRFPIPPENRKGTKRNAKIMCLYQRYS